MSAWQTLLLIAALTVAWHITSAVVRAVRDARRESGATALPELLRPGYSIGSRDGERWTVTAARLDLRDGGQPTLTVDLIRSDRSHHP